MDHTSTGHGPPPVAGVQTLRYRQSSSPGGVGPCANSEIGRFGCGAGGPGASASSSPVHGSTGAGAAQRRAPTGGAAYGTPRKAPSRPRTRPLLSSALALRTGTHVLERLAQARRLVARLQQLHDVERGAGEVVGEQAA